MLVSLHSNTADPRNKSRAGAFQISRQFGLITNIWNGLAEFHTKLWIVFSKLMISEIECKDFCFLKCSFFMISYIHRKKGLIPKTFLKQSLTTNSFLLAKWTGGTNLP